MPIQVMPQINEWTERYLSAMSILHQFKNYDTHVSPRQIPTPDILVKILNKLLIGEYDPTEYFATGGALKFEPGSTPPRLAEGAHYTVICLNVSTPRSEFVSSQSGGILFEDPVAAIFAAIATKSQLGVPIAKDNAELWNNAVRIASEVKAGNFKPDHFFGPILNPIPPSKALQFDLVTVDSAQLLALREKGKQTLKVGVPPKFFELFQPPKVTSDKNGGPGF